MIADCNRAIQLDPRLAIAYNARGYAKLMKGNLAQTGLGKRNHEQMMVTEGEGRQAHRRRSTPPTLDH